MQLLFCLILKEALLLLVLFLASVQQFQARYPAVLKSSLGNAEKSQIQVEVHNHKATFWVNCGKLVIYYSIRYIRVGFYFSPQMC